jgi:hypothetical protein
VPLIQSAVPAALKHLTILASSAIALHHWSGSATFCSTLAKHTTGKGFLDHVIISQVLDYPCVAAAAAATATSVLAAVNAPILSVTMTVITANEHSSCSPGRLQQQPLQHPLQRRWLLFMLATPLHVRRSYVSQATRQKLQHRTRCWQDNNSQSGLPIRASAHPTHHLAHGKLSKVPVNTLALQPHLV